MILGDSLLPIYTALGTRYVTPSKRGRVIPVHRMVLAARCKALEEVLDGKVKGLQSPSGNVSVRFAKSLTSTTAHSSATKKKALPRLLVSGVHTLSVLIFLLYLYTSIKISSRATEHPSDDFGRVIGRASLSV